MTPQTRALTNGLKYIRSQQQRNGGFISESSPSQQLWKPAYTYHTTFVPSLILASLSIVDTPESHKIRSGLARFLPRQKSEQWSFNYWAKTAAERKTMPYPDDLDDTFCALIGLQAHDPKLVDEGALAHIVKLLLATETQVGGPYKTWLVSREADAIWQDTDLAVNANILCFLSRVSEPLPNLSTFIETAIARDSYQSPYYPSPYPLWYYLARAYRGPLCNKLERHILAHYKKHTRHTALDTALTLSALTQLNPKHTLIPQLTLELIAAQMPDGSWPAVAFCIDPVRDERTHYHGSSALTTALAVEALNRAQAIQKKSPRKSAPAAGPIKLQQTIVAQGKRELNALPPDLRAACNSVFSRVVANDTDHEITLLPHMFAQALPAATRQKLPEQLFVHLGLANLYGWIAYTIYDDFLDDEGQPMLLSAANTCLRLSVRHFQEALPRNPAFQQLVNETFDSIDNANTWEIARCRFAVTSGTIALSTMPRYGRRFKLAERSLGHGLSPLAILVAAGVPVNDPKITTYARAFSHYLIARQLNDDAHDWKEDLQKGHITYVVGLILEQCGTKGALQLNTFMPTAEKQFWNHTLVDVCSTMRTHCRQGRALLSSVSEIDAENILAQLFASTEKSIEKTLSAQTQALDFLKNYRGK